MEGFEPEDPAGDLLGDVRQDERYMRMALVEAEGRHRSAPSPCTEAASWRATTTGSNN